MVGEVSVDPSQGAGRRAGRRAEEGRKGDDRRAGVEESCLRVKRGGARWMR